METGSCLFALIRIPVQPGRKERTASPRGAKMIRPSVHLPLLCSFARQMPAGRLTVIPPYSVSTSRPAYPRAASTASSEFAYTTKEPLPSKTFSPMTLTEEGMVISFRFGMSAKA